ncbi:6-phosphogluconolactonase [Yimella sp. cx-573]|nr:6-phosphogluconolactonase [Yimella sp. cx-573]
MTDRSIQTRANKSELAQAIAATLDDRVDDALRSRLEAHVALTGGSMGQEFMKAWAARNNDDRDWSQVHIWWGDERFVAAGDAERNDQQADDAGLKKLGVPQGNIHRVPSSDDNDGDVAAGAQAYADELARWSDSTTDGLAQKLPMPTFDVLMLGMGPDGHVASLFPQHQDQLAEDTTVIAVNDSPKPPPTRISLTFPALAECREAWLMVAGADKAEAVARAFGKPDSWECPASVIDGQIGTTWWLDDDAAGQLEQG